MRKVLSATISGVLTATMMAVLAAHTSPLDAAESTDVFATMTLSKDAEASPIRWFHEIASGQRSEPEPPSKLAIIACRVKGQAERSPTGAPRITKPDWLLPLECMRVIETVSDAAAMTNLWLRQMQPNLAEHGSCAEVAMHFAPEWEASHRNWLIVKIGCPTKIVDADGRTIGWHMPECQGTLPGTRYPLRCRFDPSEI